jgi:hypothetical protein
MIRFRLVTAQSSQVNADGFWGVQSDAHGKNAAVGHFGMQHSFGFIARPVDPDANGGLGCLVLEGTEGHSEGFSWLCHDPRYYSKIPPLSQGSACMYNSAGAFIILDVDKETGIWYQLYDDSGTTKAHKLTMGKDGAGVPVVELKGGEGQYLQFQDSKATLRGTGNASIKLDGNNCDLNGTANVAGSLTVATGTIPVALSAPLVSYLTALEAVLTTISAATVPATSPAVVAFISAGAALKTAMVSLSLKAQ